MTVQHFRILTLGFALSLLQLTGCEVVPYDVAYKAALKHGLSTNADIKKFEKVFDQTTHAIYQLRQRGGVPEWQSDAAMYDRYIVTMQMYIELDNHEREIKKFNSPTIRILEYTSLQFHASGGIRARSDGLHYEFTPESWSRFVDSGGDFSAIGLELETNKPLDGFDRFWKRQ